MRGCGMYLLRADLRMIAKSGIKLRRIAKERGSRLLNEELRGEQVVVIGDTPLDIRCARAIGAKVLAVATGMFRLEVGIA